MRRALWVAALAAIACGCGGAPHGSVGAMDEVERARVSPAIVDAKGAAPQAYAVAEREREASRASYDAGDEVAASLHAEHALAAYQHAVVLARLARAEQGRSAAEATLATSDDEAHRLAAARTKVDAEGDALEKELTLVREKITPPSSGPVDPQREAARVVAARSLATQARLLCGAARLLGDVPELAPQEKRLDALDAELDPPTGTKAAPSPSAPKGATSRGGAMIDEAARVRAGCLDVLTRARRSAQKSGSGQADALLAELSAAGGWDPVRDERGVVVTLRDAFHGDAVTKEADARLTELGRVLAAHPGHAAEIVVHDATVPSRDDLLADMRRGERAAKILADTAKGAKVQAFTAGARAPLVDPSDAQRRGRNARLEVVFVTPGE